MPRPSREVDVFLEVGSKRTFAGTIEWPGWCRAGRDETSALQALLEYGPRYARVLRGTRLGFAAPADGAAFAVVERLKGDATTDFGAPGAAPKSDRRPVGDADLRRFGSILRASWRAFDTLADDSRTATLRPGPRGGGRKLDAIVRHVLEAEQSYVSMIGGRVDRAGPGDETEGARRAVFDALGASARGEVPERGPRGGKRWTARYFVRRAAWHVLDHAWEIEDRAT
jgi:hypothetical protein